MKNLQIHETQCTYHQCSSSQMTHDHPFEADRRQIKILF